MSENLNLCKEQRDWSKFEPPIERFDPKEFKPFDKILARDSDELEWLPSFLRRIIKEPSGGYSAVGLVSGHRWEMYIPYNNETEHLLGTTDACPDYYKWWEK